jgi:hypothetical protein
MYTRSIQRDKEPKKIQRSKGVDRKDAKPLNPLILKLKKTTISAKKTIPFFFLYINSEIYFGCGLFLGSKMKSLSIRFLFECVFITLFIYFLRSQMYLGHRLFLHSSTGLCA